MSGEEGVLAQLGFTGAALVLDCWKGDSVDGLSERRLISYYSLLVTTGPYPTLNAN
jgi:hypothetical protein